MFFPEEKMRLVLQIQYRALCILQNVNAKNAKKTKMVFPL